MQASWHDENITPPKKKKTSSIIFSANEDMSSFSPGMQHRTYPAVLASFVKIKRLQRLGKCPGKPELSEVHQTLGCTC